MLKERLGREKFIVRRLKRASKLEAKLKREEGSKITQACLSEIRNREKRGNT